ncbi:MAG: hypothetical protein PHD76_08115 [Methylacidiphilales bacterium]|nr:hypothetical protein [Candidatus Methylacidiphilales bacterium]
MCRFYAITLLFLLQACCASPPAAEQKTAQSQGIPEAASALITEEDLAKSLLIENQTANWDQSGIFLAQSRVVNNSSAPLAVQIRTIFKNQEGMTMEVSPWKQFTLQPKQELAYGAPSINRFSSRFLLEIRRPAKNKP